MKKLLFGAVEIALAFVLMMALAFYGIVYNAECMDRRYEALYSEHYGG